MKRFFSAFIIIVCICCVVSVDAKRQNTSRGKLKPVHTEKTESKLDTLWAPVEGVTLTGYEKTQRSMKENVFVTNSSSRHITGVNLTIDYFTADGRQLHQRDVSLICDVPKRQTRMLEFKAWDRQNVWYYINTQARHNEYSNPFDVKIRLNYVIVTK